MNCSKRTNVHCVNCGKYVKPEDRAVYVGYEDDLLCKRCAKEGEVR